MRVLLSGFEPFDNDSFNPSGDIAQRLDGRKIGRRRIEGLVLPVTFADAARRLLREVDKREPDLVVSLGLAATRDALTPELFATNIVDARIPDNAGRQPVFRAIDAHEPAAFRSTLRVQPIIRSVRALGLKAEISLSAGSFVCNDLFFRLMRGIADRRCRAGFVHLPPTREHFEMAHAWPAEQLLAAVEALIAVA
jgi:pyroglutamyl-peptidase